MKRQTFLWLHFLFLWLQSKCSFAGKGIVLPKNMTTWLQYIIPYERKTSGNKNYHHSMSYYPVIKIKPHASEKFRCSRGKDDIFLGSSHFKTTGKPSTSEHTCERPQVRSSEGLQAVSSGRLECKSLLCLIWGGGEYSVCLSVQLRAISSQSLRVVFFHTNDSLLWEYTHAGGHTLHMCLRTTVGRVTLKMESITNTTYMSKYVISNLIWVSKYKSHFIWLLSVTFGLPQYQMQCK